MIVHETPTAEILTDNFVCVADEKIVGTFFYNFDADIEPTYRKILTASDAVDSY